MKATIKTLLLSGMFASMTACTAITEVTSSTSSTLDAVTPDVTLNRFIDQRYDSIRKDAAKGGGENIEALAQLMGEKNSEQLGKWMQAHYDQLFSASNQPEQLAIKIEQFNTTKG